MEEIKVTLVFTYEWKNIDIVNSTIFFLSELEEMKSCIYRVETANAGIGLYWFWHHLLVMQLEEIVLFNSGRSRKMQSGTNFCNHYPVFTQHIAGLRIENGKSWLERVGNKCEGNDPRYRHVSKRIRLGVCWKAISSSVYILSNESKLFNCIQRHSVSQYREFSNVFYRKSTI